MWGAGRLLKTFQPSWVLENQEKREGRRQKQKTLKKTSQFSQKLFSTHSLASHDTSLRKLLAVEIYICVCVCVCIYINIFGERGEGEERVEERTRDRRNTERENNWESLLRFHRSLQFGIVFLSGLGNYTLSQELIVIFDFLLKEVDSWKTAELFWDSALSLASLSLLSFPFLDWRCEG